MTIFIRIIIGKRLLSVVTEPKIWTQRKMGISTNEPKTKKSSATNNPTMNFTMGRNISHNENTNENIQSRTVYKVFTADCQHDDIINAQTNDTITNLFRCESNFATPKSEFHHSCRLRNFTIRDGNCKRLTFFSSLQHSIAVKKKIKT